MTVVVTRMEHTASDLRRRAGRADDAAVARRLLALALVLDGHKREDAARLTGMDRQTLRDWVHRYNADGVAGLSYRHGGGVTPRLSAEQETQIAGWAGRGCGQGGAVALRGHPGAHAVLVCDGAGWHQTGGRLNVPKNISLLHLPPTRLNSTRSRPSGNTCAPTRSATACPTTTTPSWTAAAPPGTGSWTRQTASGPSQPGHGPNRSVHETAGIIS